MSYIEADVYRDDNDRVFIHWRDGKTIHKEWQGKHDSDTYPDEVDAKLEYATREHRILQNGFKFIGHKPVIENTPFAAMTVSVPQASTELTLRALKRAPSVE